MKIPQHISYVLGHECGRIKRSNVIFCQAIVFIFTSMKQGFKAIDAQKLMEKAPAFSRISATLQAKEESYLDKITACVQNLRKEAAIKVLEGIPIEELLRAVPRLKVKTLREMGLTNYAQVYDSTDQELDRFYPVSIETARLMKDEVQNIVSKAMETVKIKIDSERKDHLSTNLVQALYVYRKALPTVKECITAVDGKADYIASALQDLEPATHAIKFFFRNKTVKEAAAAAYEGLFEILEGSIWQNITQQQTAINKIEVALARDAWLDFEKNSVEYYTLLEKLFPDEFQKENEIYGLPTEISQEIQQEQPTLEGMKCALRRYQEWGVKYILHQGKVLLGDEMGLGKTVQAIAAMIALRNGGATHFLVVCPASVLTNWCREIETRSNLKYIKIHGSNRLTDIEKWKAEGGVAVTTYETTNFFSLEPAEAYSMLVVDEVHYIKNPGAKRSINVRRLCEHTERLLFMTGTALENRVKEMLSLIGILRPAIAQKAADVAAMAVAPQFLQLIAPVYYRRKREQVLSELPELIESEEWCDMGEQERDIYESAILDGKIQKARQMSFNSPNSEDACKIRRLKELVEEAELENRKVLVFSYFLNTIAVICNVLGDRCVSPITGAVSPKQRQDIIDEFSKAPAGTVLVSQITAGGVGLNIQAASMVILCEPQYKPSSETQAISRAFRMGQVRNVLVYRLLCSDSIDERITALLKYKQSLFDAFADKSVSGEQSLELDSKMVNNILEEEIKHIKEKRALPKERELLKEAFHNSEKTRIEQKKSKRPPLPGELDDEEFVAPSKEFLSTTFDLYNNLYFDGELPDIEVSYGNIGTAVGQYIPNEPRSIIINSIYKLKYYQYRNVLVHEMCHYLTDLKGCGAGAGDGHSKEWVALAEKLNRNFPELQITLFCDEKLVFN